MITYALHPCLWPDSADEHYCLDACMLCTVRAFNYVSLDIKRLCIPCSKQDSHRLVNNYIDNRSLTLTKMQSNLLSVVNHQHYHIFNSEMAATSLDL